MDLIDLFPNTIAVSHLTTLTDDVIAQAKTLIDNDAAEGIPGDGTYTREQQLLNNPVFGAVKAEITGLCLEYAHAHSHDVRRIGICNSWGNSVAENENIRYHSHDNAYIGGVFYLTEGSAFNLLNPVGSELFGGFMPARKADSGDNFRAWDSFNIQPKPGRIILFPAGMKHSVLPSREAEKRYSIAFNAIPLGKIGIPTSMINIELAE